MTWKDENREWEKEAPVLAHLTRTAPFTVPEGYFETLPAQISSAIQLDQLPSMSGFSVPEDYFAHLSDRIEAHVSLEKIRLLANETPAFDTPSNYFETLSSRIMERVSEPTPSRSKVVRLWKQDLVKYATAACVILLSAIGLHLQQKNHLISVRNTELAQELFLYPIDERVIIEHLTEAQASNHMNLSDLEMENYILNHYSSGELSTDY